jgi:6-phosphogluconolactonase
MPPGVALIRQHGPCLFECHNRHGPKIPRMEYIAMKSTKYLVLAGLLAMGSQLVAHARAENARDASGAVFVMTNAAVNNQIAAYARAENGELQAKGTYSTGGNGSGGTVDPLHSQGSLVLSWDHHLLFAVNAGSGTVSSFAVEGSKLTLVDTEPSGGSSPNAIAQIGNILYVLNQGGSGNVSGFRLSGNGRLRPISNSIRSLSGSATSPTSITFSPNGQFLVVTESATNKIDVFRVLGDGKLSGITTDTSSDVTPFAAVFDSNGALIVASATNFVSSYTLNRDLSLKVVSGSVPTQGQATCWGVVSSNGHRLFTDNANSSNVSGFAIARNGSLTAIDNTILAQSPAGSANLDIAESANGKFLYSLYAGTGGIGVFAVDHDGTLTALTPISGLPASSGLNGIAAY